MPTPNLKKIKLYLLKYAEDDFFGQYKNGSMHYFSLKNDRSGWEIIPYGTPLWDSLDQDTWIGTDINEWYGEGSKHILPDWLPEIPSIIWKHRYSDKQELPKSDYRFVAKYMNNNKVSSFVVFLLFRKEGDPFSDEPTQVFLNDVSLKQYNYSER